MVNAVDSLQILRWIVVFTVFQEPGCPPIGSTIPAADPYIFADVDCRDDVTAVDALKILRFVAVLSQTQIEPCTDIGFPILP